MCGRFVRKLYATTIESEFDVDEVEADLAPSYNVAPSQQVAVVMRKDDKTRLVSMKWGLIPAWSNDPSIGNRLINARAETVAEKPSFREAFMRQRCLVIADGFYEWQKHGRSKQPYFIHLKEDRPFGFAGLYDLWTSPQGELISTCTIITTEPNEIMKTLHDRMPVILPKEFEAAWLDPYNADPASLARMLCPYAAGEMEMHTVSTLVNSPANDSPECMAPAAPVGQLALW
ncbi:MAG: SOS response-associated peptidase [Acidobacteriota bacterium]